MARGAETETNPYPFKVEPLKAISTLTAVPLAKVPARFFTKPELALLRDAETGKLESLSLAEALLLASGVTDNDERARFMEQIDKITSDARKALARARSPRDRGTALLAFLHDHGGPMAGRFENGQANLATLLETTKYNCVSSAAMFMVVGQRLGLRLRMVEVPEHVFCQAFDGQKWVDVEPTSARGYGAKPDRKVLTDIKTKHGIEDGSPKAAEFFYPVNNLQLVAIVYFCHGTLLGTHKHNQEGVAAKLFSLALDPHNPHAVGSTITEINHWCDDLIVTDSNAAALGLAHRYEQILKNPAKAKSLIAKAGKPLSHHVAAE